MKQPGEAKVFEVVENGMIFQEIAKMDEAMDLGSVVDDYKPVKLREQLDAIFNKFVENGPRVVNASAKCSIHKG